MRRVLSIIISALMLFSLISVAAGAAESTTLGDVDGNSKIDSADATLVLQRYADIITDDANDYDPDAADVNFDGEVNSEDATLILQRYAEIITDFENNDDPTDDTTDATDASESEDEGYAQYVWPAPGCTIITSYWGDSRNHKGIDITCPGSSYGMPIVAAASGTVTIANRTDSWGSGWGYYIKIDHGGGYSRLYAHCSQLLVSVGQNVSAGELIGYIGETGNVTGAHLHFETWYNSTRYDPAPHLGLEFDKDAASS